MDLRSSRLILFSVCVSQTEYLLLHVCSACRFDEKGFRNHASFGWCVSPPNTFGVEVARDLFSGYLNSPRTWQHCFRSRRFHTYVLTRLSIGVVRRHFSSFLFVSLFSCHTQLALFTLYLVHLNS